MANKSYVRRMKPEWQSEGFWKFCLAGLVLGYCFYYAPFGINETDGGFITGLAWQIRNGKTLYDDLIYVRPPLPVWLRVLEMSLFPDHWAVLGERWSFYFKVALYSWLGAAVLAQGKRRWMLSTFSFVLSAHCYPAAAWHTVDGLLFGALGIWSWTNCPGRRGALFSGIAMAAALLCKQSFYPMAGIWGIFILAAPSSGPSFVRKSLALGAFFLLILFFFTYLYANNLLEPFGRLTSGAASGGQGLQHGILDYFRIQPIILVLGLLSLAPVGWWAWSGRGAQWAVRGWIFLLFLLAGLYARSIFQRGEFTAPFSQSRLLFWIAVGYGIWQFTRRRWTIQHFLRFAALLALCWSASLSWGYNLPLLFALPWAYAGLDLSAELSTAAYPRQRMTWAPVTALILLLAVFRWGYEYVYRDGTRTDMTAHLGAIFPKLSGIYSSPQTAEQYRDLRDLALRYRQNFKTLPAFPLANYLTDSYPPLPLDWVVLREMGAGQPLVESAFLQEKPVLFIEKNYLARLESDPELKMTFDILQNARVMEETDFFIVVRK